MCEWIGVKERLPESEAGVVLVCGPAMARQVKRSVVGYGVHSEKLFDGWRVLGSISSPFRIREVTHWMPTPEATEGAG